MGKVNPKGSATGTKAQNAEWLANDLIPTKDAKIRITLSLDAAVVIEVTVDSGTNWLGLNNNGALTVDGLFVFDVPVRIKDKFNIRIPTAGGATINLCRIDEISGEG